MADFNDFQKFGHPGRYNSSYLVTSGSEITFTGSMYGYGGILVSGSDSDFTIELTGGGSINSALLSTGVIHELSVYKVHSGSSGTIYVLKGG